MSFQERKGWVNIIEINETLKGWFLSQRNYKGTNCVLWLLL